MSFRKIVLSVSLIAFLGFNSLFMSSCGGKDSKYDTSEEESTEDGVASAAISLADAGSIKGVVSFEGTAPVASPLAMESDPVCSAKKSEATNEYQDVCINDGKLGNVFVYISKGLEGKSFPESSYPKAELDQSGCKYIPRIIGAVVGQQITIKNQDPTMHNVHATPTINKGFNIAQPNAGMTAQKSFDKEETMVTISCDVHGWMRSYVGVCSHPCFAVSAKDGSFNIPNVPPGDYTVTAWHEKFGKQEQVVKIAAKESKDLPLTFKAQ
ncbi:MAG: hypothetical protein IPP08_04725 [Chlorobiota bacterium]|nr:hypothetical protein [Chlorobiota bacterium]QQS67474.1 MAG: hypothetical protein IPP08_04725 [Chlorobiota bacterium]